MNKYEKAEKFAKEVFSGFSPKLLYHNIHHALDVKNAALQLGSSESIQGDSLELIGTAALYHDIGFIKTYEGHEGKGIEMVRSHFNDFGFSREETEIVCSMISATKLPQQPKAILERVLCDADLDNLGRKDFFDILEKLFEERNNFGFTVSKNDWYNQTLELIRNHDYFTLSARNLRDEQKKKNIELLIKRLNTPFE